MNVVLSEQVKSVLTRKYRLLTKLLYKLPFIQYPYPGGSYDKDDDRRNVFKYLWDNLYKTVKWKWQKFSKGYNDCDLWDLHSTFVDFMLPRLKSFRKAKLMGYPSEMDGTDETGLNDIPGFDYQKAAEADHDHDHYENNFKKWLSVLDRIIFTFEYIKDDMDTFEPDYKYPETYFEPCKDHSGCSTMEHKFKDEEHKKDHEAYWKRYMAETDRREKVIKEGLALFSKYFRSLWD